MKKALVAVGIIGLCVLVYFICGDSEKTEDSQSSLMTSAQDQTKSGSTSSETEYEYDTDVEQERAEQDEARKTPENTVTFTVRGENRTNTYKSVNPFIKIARSSDLTGDVVNFASDMIGIKVSDQSTYRHVFSMMIPGDVTPGSLSERSGNFMVQYFGTETGVMYSLDVNYPFTLTIDEWGGSGGRARGTFSGELKVNGSGAVIYIQDGRFDAAIQ